MESGLRQAFSVRGENEADLRFYGNMQADGNFFAERVSIWSRTSLNFNIA